MAEPTEIQQLQNRIAELERHLVEEREEFQWDLKTRCEAYERNIRRLEDENTQLKQVATASPAESAELHRLRDDVGQYTHRALKAERRVAELQEEIKRLSIPVAPPLPRQDPVLRARAEEAEHERDRARQALVKYENELKQLREELTRQAQQGRETARIQEELEQQKKLISQLRREGNEKDQKLLELSDRLEASATLESQYNALRREVEQARARNLQLEQILVEREESEPLESGSEYQGVLEVTQPVVFSKTAGPTDETVVAGVAEATSGDELLPVISPDELYPDEASSLPPATQPDQAPAESLAPAAEPAAEEIAIVRSEPPVVIPEAAAPKPDSPGLDGIAEAWLVSDEPRPSMKSNDQPKSDASGQVGERPPPPLPSQPVARQALKKPEPLELPRRRTKVGIFVILAVVGVLLGAGIFGMAYFYPNWFELDDWIANVSSWISVLKSKSIESTPGSETDASHAKNGVTDGDGASVNNAEVPREKPATSAPAATPVPDSENTATGAEPVKPPAGEAMPGKTATPETDGGGSGATDSPSVQKKPSAEQVEAREGGFILVNNKAWTKAEKQIGQALQTFP